jgi:hypothetical protein
VKEILGILRMVKQFGWEARVKEQLDEAREEELKWIFRRKLLNLVNMCINYTGTHTHHLFMGRALIYPVPLCHMVATFGCYTLVAKKPLSAAIVFSALTGTSTFLYSRRTHVLTGVARLHDAPIVAVHAGLLRPAAHSG